MLDTLCGQAKMHGFPTGRGEAGGSAVLPRRKKIHGVVDKATDMRIIVRLSGSKSPPLFKNLAKTICVGAPRRRQPYERRARAAGAPGGGLPPPKETKHH